MTATTTLTVNQLLQLKDDEFETTIKDMGQRNLMDMITGLQKEMAKEQENFNSMSEELKGFKDKNSRQYKQISKDLMSSQTRLTSLMNRSMKCFAQQNLQQGKDGVILRRRNSTKGENPSSTKIVQRSKSMYIPQDPPLEPSTPALLHTGSNQNINRIPINSSNNHASSPKTWNNSTSNIIRIQNSKNPNISSQSFSSMSPYSNHISHSTSDIYEKSRLISQSSSDIPRNSTKISINSQQPSVEKKTVSVNLHPENMKTSISIGSNYAKITSSSSNISNEPIKSDTNNEESKGSQDLQNLPNVRQLAQSFGSSKQPNAPPRPNRASVLMNRNLSMSSQTLSTPQKVNGVQSSLQNGDLESKQRGVVSQPLNIRGNKNVANVRPVSVVDARETTPQGQSVNMVQKAHSVQNLNSNTSDTPVKTTLNVSFGNSSKKTNGVTVNNMVVNRQIENKTPENRHSWFGQQGDVSNETQKKPSDNQTSSTTNINITPQPNKNTDRKIDVKSASKTELSQNNGKQNDDAGGATSQKLNITTVSSTVTSQSDSDDKKLRPINIKKGNQSGLSNGDVEEDDVLVVTPRMNLMSWNPIKLLNKLYHVKLIEETAEDISYKYVSMEGYMEKLPMNKKKATLLKTWKRRYFQAKDGWIHYFESGNRDKPSDSVQLMGGKILEMTDLGSKILGIDDGRGRFLMVRVPTDKEYGQWLLALESQTLDNTKACYVQPVLTSIPHPKKKVLVIDMGSSAIRAGLLGEHASLPQMFFPCTAAVNKTNSDIVIGVDAYHPDVRSNSNLIHPVHPSNKIDKFTIDWKAIKIMFQKIIQELKINPSQYWVMLSTPQSLGDNLKEGLMNILIDDLHTCGVCMVQQSLLSLYSYKATSGIIVDIGQRIEILPIFDGFVIEGGVSRLPYGSQKILDSLIISLLENNYSFSSNVEQLIVKYIMEQSCFVANNYKNELENCKAKDNKILTTVKLDDIDLPPAAYKEVKFDEGRFKSPEGLFDTDMWEMDYPNLHKLIFQAIQACPMDSRRHMYRAIYLSGGVTMLPGFADRFRTELTKLAPPGVPIEVHASQNRYHAAYIGACSVAGMAEFEMMCISREEWKKEGKKSFRKWKAPTL